MPSLFSRIQNWRARAVTAEQRITAMSTQIGELGTELRGFKDELARRNHNMNEQLEVHLRASNLRPRTPLPSTRRTRVLFLVHHIEAWESLDALCRLMKISEDFEVVVASIPRRFPGAEEFGDEDKVDAELTSRGIEHVRLVSKAPFGAWPALRAIDPDIIFRQSQWDRDLQPSFSTAALSFARLCIVPYETMNIVQNAPSEDPWMNTAVDSDYHRSCWMVFCANDLVKNAAAHGLLNGRQFHIVGHPKADSIRAAKPLWPVEGPLSEAGKVVWSAHHSIVSGWTDFGLFPSISESMLRWALESPDVEFVFMPHPALRPFTKSSHSPITQRDFDDFLSRWSALPNTAVFADGDYPRVLRASDVLITDGLSLLVEYQLLLKPVIFLERDGHRPFNEIGELVREGMHSVQTVEDARRFAEGFLNGATDPLIDAQRENGQRLFGDAVSAPRILEALRAEIISERATHSG